MQPFLNDAAVIKADIVDLKERFKLLKKEKTDLKKLDELEAQIREKEKTVKELESKVSSIDAAVFDLKAVNPNAVTKMDDRTTHEIIANIEHQGLIVSKALNKLAALLAETE